MTITQLQYIVAVEDCKSFAKAAEKCHITQPTLSMQIKKLEQGLNVQLFDRSRKPVCPTAIGKQIIEQARISLREINRVQDIISANEEDSSGELSIGIIPTLSPYLLPLFAIPFIQKYPDIVLTVKEMISEDIVYNLYNNNIDLGILVTPCKAEDLIEMPLFYEPFVAYLATNHPLSIHKQLDFCDLDLNNMWLLKEGHCFRNQVINICGENSMSENKNALRFESGSLETLRRIVERQYGYTLLPELATLEFTEKQQQLVKQFSDPKPTREVSLIRSRKFMKRKIVAALKETILEHIPDNLKQKGKGEIIEWKE